MDTRLVLGASLAFCVALAPTSLAADAGLASSSAGLAPRKPLSKTPTERLLIPVDRDGKLVATGRLIVKFHDSVRARTTLDRSRSLQSLSAENVRGVEEILAAHRLTVRQAISRTPDKLRNLELRAETNSRRAQPDLAGMMYVEGPLDVLERAARELNEVPIIEWVEFEQEMVYHRAPAPGGDPPPCGEPAAGDCYEANPSLNCDDEECCNLVGGLNPICTDEQFGGEWDIFCVNLANLFCNDGDRCKTQLVNGGCFDAHQSPGCNNEACCNAVAAVEPYCILVQWDLSCVALATSLCGAGSPDVPTPNYSMTSTDPTTRLQKYTTPEPSVPGDAYFDSTGFSGDGLNLAGLEELGQTLLDVYGVGKANGTRGLGIRAGVVEHTAYVTGEKGGEEWHEDLLDVIPEPNQTIITIIGGVLSPSHGTAALSQIVASHNGQGMSGIARDAQGYFFPIVSVEEGGRTANAIISAFELFEPGDVLNYSIGPGGGGTLVSNQATWTLINLGSDLGITSIISAGNDCFNLDAAAQFDGEDSGVIIVGACYPGSPDGGWPLGLGRFCRLGFSNHCRDCDAGEPEPANVVHVSAWGTLVSSAGYGDLFVPPNAAGTGPNWARSYSAVFNGTSAAAPIITGFAACLQGLAKQFYGTPLTPRALRGVIEGNVFNQCDSPAPAELPGAPDGNECAFDFDPDSDARLIGGFPRAFEAGVGVISGNFFSTSPLTDVKVITGKTLTGNVNSIKAVDGNFLSVRSRKTSPGNQGAGTPPAITYLAAGETTDIEVSAQTLLPAVEVIGLGLESVTSATVDFVLLAMYAYNFEERRWTFLPAIDFIGPAGATVQGAVPEPEKHVSETGQMKARVWTCGLGAVPNHVVFYDFVNIAASQVPVFEPK